MNLYEVTIAGRMYVHAESKKEAIGKASETFSRAYHAEAIAYAQKQDKGDL